MNHKKLDKYWKEFAKKENAELVYIENELFEKIRCEYILTIAAEFYKTKIVGTYWKSMDGCNRNSTIIYIKYNRKALQTLHQNNNEIMKSFFSKNELKTLENYIHQSFENAGGKELRVFKDLLRIELNEIISNHSEFEEISEIINIIRTTANKAYN